MCGLIVTNIAQLYITPYSFYDYTQDMVSYYHFFCSALQLGQHDLFQNQGTMHPSWKICLQLSSLITSPLMNPFKQMEHSFSVLPIFIFFIPSSPFFPKPNNSFSKLSCYNLNCTESFSINYWKSPADMPQMGDSVGGFSSSQLQSMMALYSFCQSMKFRLYFPLGFILMGRSDIRFNNIMWGMQGGDISIECFLGGDGGGGPDRRACHPGMVIPGIFWRSFWTIRRFYGSRAIPGRNRWVC